MNNITFGSILENLLYISNQKKSTLANTLGYDISYINKWISSRNLPSSKRINEICKDIALFIMDSLNNSTYENLINYFEIDENSDEEYIIQYIEETLKNAYMNEIRGMSDKGTQNIPKNTHSEEFYNSLSNVEATVVQREFANEIFSLINKGENLDIILSFNLFDLTYKDKVSLGKMKKTFYEISRNTNTKIKILMGLDNERKNKDQMIINTLIGINFISTYPALDFEVYNCNINPNSTISVIKDKFLINTTHYPDGECLLSTYSKDKSLIEDMYYSLVRAQKQKGKSILI